MIHKRDCWDARTYRSRQQILDWTTNEEVAML